MHLHRLGAGQPESVTFVADGTPWLWDLLHNCHGSPSCLVGPSGVALEEHRRHELYLHYRTLLRNGNWRQVVDELKELGTRKPGEDAIMTELTYLRKHGMPVASAIPVSDV